MFKHAARVIKYPAVLDVLASALLAIIFSGMLGVKVTVVLIVLVFCVLIVLWRNHIVTLFEKVNTWL